MDYAVNATERQSNLGCPLAFEACSIIAFALLELVAAGEHFEKWAWAAIEMKDLFHCKNTQRFFWFVGTESIRAEFSIEERAIVSSQTLSN